MLPTFDIPQVWILLFLGLLPLPVIMLSRLAHRGAPDGKKGVYALSVAVFYAIYFVYVIVGEHLGWFAKNIFPAKIILLGTIPFALVLFGLVWNSSVFKNLSRRLKVADFVEVHLFRVMGGFFIVLAALDTLPLWFGLIAGIGDVTAALGSILVAGGLRRGYKKAEQWAKIWNTFGFVDILFTAIAANVLTKLALDNGGDGVAVLAQFPFILIPAFAPPTIIFLHLIIYKKLARQS
ncbi:MAG: hypothetical protein AAF741_16865 [Bacteroidota bacterium]